ncbi:MAG: AMP-binding protein [Deltaproteobacteria bacterium]|nr:AMP-binding protein [Deltaproteobacteria bacterium]
MHGQGALSSSRRLDDAVADDLDATARLLALAQARGAGFVLLSRLSVVGPKKGLCAEVDPRTVAFGGSAVKGKDLDVAACRASLAAEVAHVRACVTHADAAAARRQRVRDELVGRGGPSAGQGFERAVDAAHERDVARAMRAALVARASGWRFPTASATALRGFSRALAELHVVTHVAAVAEQGGRPAAIMRLPELLVGRAPVGGAVHAADAAEAVDRDGGAHGALAAVFDRVHDGALRLPFAPRARLEALPHDLVADATAAVILAQTKATTGLSVVHVATADRAPLPVERLLDLLDLHLRRRTHRRSGPTAIDAPPARPLLAPALHVDAATPLPPGLDVAADLAARGVSGLLQTLGDRAGGGAGPAAALVDELQASVRALGRSSGADVALCQAPPFFVDDVRFAQRGLRLACTKAGVPVVDPGAVDWREHLLRRQLPALDRARKARRDDKARAPIAAYDSLAHLLIEAAARHKNRPALSVFLPPAQVAPGELDIVDVTYGELLGRARAVALRLQQAGVQRGDRVVLCAQNHPAWGICAFGVLLLGATLVPLDVNLELDAADNVLRKARAAVAVVDKHVRARLEPVLAARVPPPLFDLHLLAATGPGIDLATHALPTSTDLASILFTSGTTGEPKGVMLSHGNFCALLGSLLAVFPVGDGDRMLSVLPIHHTFEFTCGFLMPLATGAQIYTPDAIVGDRVTYAMKAGRITAIVGVPALWQLLERRMKKTIDDRGDLVSSVFKTLLSANKKMGAKLGVSAGRLLFKPIHDQLGGHLRILISGGSALPPAVHELFQGIGLPLAEGYGLTETAPVLTVAEGKLGAPAGTVGTPVPGVTLRLVDPETGHDVDASTGAVGELWAQAENVMLGYFENDDATQAVLTADRWFKTGDLGTIDQDGRVRLVGRSKDVVVTASGENVYLDDVEKKLESVPGVFELTLLGVPDPRGGERLALVATASAIDDPPLGTPMAASDDPERLRRARAAVGQRVLKLPQFQRPAIIEVLGTPLPRTSTRKVKRKQVKTELLELLRKREADVEAVTPDSVAAISAARSAIARAAGVDVVKLQAQTSLPQDLAFDSLMWVELQGQLEREAGVTVDPEVLVTKETVVDVEQYVERRRADGQTTMSKATSTSGDEPRLGRATGDEDDAPKTLADKATTLATTLATAALQAPAVHTGRATLSLLQENLYSHGFDTTVEGAAFIPANRSAIVVANHTSHLDMGLIKYALGAWGSGLRPLAAKDYFFEGNPLKVAFFTHLTNLVPVDRETGSGLAFEQAKTVVQQGHVVLIFPEGTRREDGTLGAFKPLVAKLSLATGVDVLPLHLGGCYEAFPRGATAPRFGSSLRARIGPALSAAELRRLTAHLGPVQAARAASEIIRAAVVALSEGQALELHRAPSLDDVQGARRALPRPPHDRAAMA